MRLALAQARRASGRTWPNPPAGAVVFRGARVLGRGFTQAAGGAHAEVVALERALRRHGARVVRGASLAVTLEPCAHHGRTPPCVERVRDAGLARVFVGHVDPNPFVSGRGLQRLRRAGLAVFPGVLESECRAQHRGFVHVQEQGRPWIELKLATTLDGRIATHRGESKWITGPRAREAVHRLRSTSDAVLVGSGTALADDPALTARRADRVVHRPVRIVVDSTLRVGPDARLFRGAGDEAEAWVLCTQRAARSRRSALEARGVKVLPVRSRGGQVSLTTALRKLALLGLTQILVEGGGGLAAALLRANLVDEIHWFVAPRLLGGDARSALGPLGIGRLANAVALDAPVFQRLGDDRYCRARVRRARLGTQP